MILTSLNIVVKFKALLYDRGVAQSGQRTCLGSRGSEVQILSPRQRSALSSAGQSNGLLSRRSKVRILQGVLGNYMVGVAQLVRASGCGPEGRGFNSHHSPKIAISLLLYFEAQDIRQLTDDRVSKTGQKIILLPSSRGLGHRPFTAATGVRLPLGVHKKPLQLWSGFLIIKHYILFIFIQYLI